MSVDIIIKPCYDRYMKWESARKLGLYLEPSTTIPKGSTLQAIGSGNGGYL